MELSLESHPNPPGSRALSNAEIADRLASLGQLLTTQKENPYKIQAYTRAAAKIRTLSESVDELVRDEADLTAYAGIGTAIASAIREIVLTGTLGRLEKLRSVASPELASISAFPWLDPKRVLRIYKKLGIGSVEELYEKLEDGEIEKNLGLRMAQHVRQGLTEAHAMLLYRAHDLRIAVEEFLLEKCGVRRAEAVGDYRRRVDVIEELAFIVETDNFAAMVSGLERYGGRTPLLSATRDTASYALSSGLILQIHTASQENWGLALVLCTGNEAHLRKLFAVTGSVTALKSKGPFPTEEALYAKFGLSFIEPELHEGYDEVTQAAQGKLPELVIVKDICGELHAHTTSSDGSNSIEQMAVATRAHGYEYIGIADHSQSLKIARGVSVEDLWKQIRFIDKLNERLDGIRVLKSAEVDILADGSLDYPDDLLRELDYTVCSVHSRFAFGKSQQTERILRARIIAISISWGMRPDAFCSSGRDTSSTSSVLSVTQSGCFFEINSSPDRLDLSAENARLAHEAGVMIAVSTDAHSTREFGTVRYGIDQARRAWLDKKSILNYLRWSVLAPLFRR